MAARGESAASGASAVKKRGLRARQGLRERARDRRIERGRRRLSVARQQAGDETLAVEACAAGQVDDDLQPLVEPAARLGRARRAPRRAAPDRAPGRRPLQRRCGALRRVDPGDRRRGRQGVEIVDDEDQPLRRAFATGRCSSARRAPRGSRAPRRRRYGARRGSPAPGRGSAPCRPARRAAASARLAAASASADSAATRWLSRRDAVVEIAAAVADVEVEKLRAAQEEAREADRAPEVERQRQGADDVEDLGGRLEQGAVRPDPIGGLRRRVGDRAAPAASGPGSCVQRLRAMQQMDGEARGRTRRSPRR